MIYNLNNISEHQWFLRNNQYLHQSPEAGLFGGAGLKSQTDGSWNKICVMGRKTCLRWV
jgi:hypothetical protein